MESRAPRASSAISLIAIVVGLVAFGLLMVYSSSFILAQERTGDGLTFIKRQLLFGALGLGALVAASRVDYRRWSKWAYPMLGFSLLLLALVFIPGVGHRVGGAQRWLRFGDFGFQPAEFAKFAIVFFVARHLARKQDRLDSIAASVGGMFFVPLPAFLLLLAQPDFGSTAVICLVIFCLLFLGGVRKRYLGGALLLASGAAAFLVMSSAYRRARVASFLDPWADPGGKGFQMIQSLLGLHHGGLTGVGLGNGKEKLFYLPEAHNDFILAVIGEELGLIGVGVVVFAFLFFLRTGLRIAQEARERAGDLHGMLLASGITLVIGLQGLINIAVVLGLLPTKGLALPLISYGGSALLVDLFAIGVLLSIAHGPRSKDLLSRRWPLEVSSAHARGA